jgi:hypothetical protein
MEPEEADNVVRNLWTCTGSWTRRGTECPIIAYATSADASVDDCSVVALLYLPDFHLPKEVDNVFTLAKSEGSATAHEGKGRLYETPCHALQPCFNSSPQQYSLTW